MIGMKKIINGMTTNGTNCKLCNHRRCKLESKNGSNLHIWGCGKRGIRFGNQWDYDEGKNMPAECAEFKQEEWREVVK